MGNPLYDDTGGLRPWVTYTTVGLAVLVGGYLVYGAWFGSDGPSAITLKCMEEGCDYERTRPLQLGESLPLKCPDCDKQSVVTTRACPNCKTAVILNEDRGLAPPAKCPKCNEEVWHGK